MPVDWPLDGAEGRISSALALLRKACRPPIAPLRWLKAAAECIKDWLLWQVLPLVIFSACWLALCTCVFSGVLSSGELRVDSWRAKLFTTVGAIMVSWGWVSFLGGDERKAREAKEKGARHHVTLKEWCCRAAVAVRVLGAGKATKLLAAYAFGGFAGGGVESDVIEVQRMLLAKGVGKGRGEKGKLGGEGKKEEVKGEEDNGGEAGKKEEQKERKEEDKGKREEKEDLRGNKHASQDAKGKMEGINDKEDGTFQTETKGERATTVEPGVLENAGGSEEDAVQSSGECTEGGVESWDGLCPSAAREAASGEGSAATAKNAGERIGDAGGGGKGGGVKVGAGGGGTSKKDVKAEEGTEVEKEGVVDGDSGGKEGSFHAEGGRVLSEGGAAAGGKGGGGVEELADALRRQNDELEAVKSALAAQCKRDREEAVKRARLAGKSLMTDDEIADSGDRRYESNLSKEAGNTAYTTANAK